MIPYNIIRNTQIPSQARFLLIVIDSYGKSCYVSHRELAKVCGMRRTTLYKYLKLLLEKGFLVKEVTPKNEHTYFISNRIKMLMDEFEFESKEHADYVENSVDKSINDAYEPDQTGAGGWSKREPGVVQTGATKVLNESIRYKEGQNPTSFFLEDLIKKYPDYLDPRLMQLCGKMRSHFGSDEKAQKFLCDKNSYYLTKLGNTSSAARAKISEKVFNATKMEVYGIVYKR